MSKKEFGLKKSTLSKLIRLKEKMGFEDKSFDEWINNLFDITINSPFICTPYVGSPLFYDNKNFILQQYDERLKLSSEDRKVSKEQFKKWKLEALDKFMSECGDATKYTATVSQYFTIPELIAIKEFMYNHDTRRMLQMSHQKYEQTGLKQWEHSTKWNKYCEICKVREQYNLQFDKIRV